MNDTGAGETFVLADYLRIKRDLIDSRLHRILKESSLHCELTRAMEHSLMAGGKRLRPVLAMAAAEAAGDFRGLIALPAACALEMIHTYSLIHDDLPAMDDDDLRRGKPTCHKAFSEATAILAGDGLLTHAFHILTTPDRYFETFPSKPVLLDIVALISGAAGVNGMIQGQMMDMLTSADTGKKSDRQELLPDDRLDHLKQIHALKTGRMIMASLRAGALSAGADPSSCDHLALYGEKIGLAFQVADDILNVEGDPAVMGKAAGSDLEHGKMTFPALLGLDASKKYAKKLVNEALDALRVFDEQQTLPLQHIAGYIITRSR